jgi:DNA (cytosine-5)-methyltransferase 1
MRLTVGSLCTGYGGLEMGLENLFGGINLAFVAENDVECSRLLEKRVGAPNLGDITQVDWWNVLESINDDTPDLDLLMAGYPCQPFSTAGKRKGDNDERAIFSYISDGIGVLRPRYLFLENVAGHLTLGGVGVIAELTKLGYDCRWGIVRASDAGAPHQRARLFIWAETSDTKKRNAGNAKQQSMDTPIRSTAKFREPTGKTIANSSSERLQRLWRERELAEGERENETTRHAHDGIKKTAGWDFGVYEKAIRRWGEITGLEVPPPISSKGVEPAFVEFMMGLPSGWVTGKDADLPRSAQMRILGNGVVPQQATLALKVLLGL